MRFKRNTPIARPWSKEKAVHLDIEKVAASRAIFQGAKEIPRVRISMTTTDSQEIDFELDIDQTRSLIEQVMATYNTILPPLKTSRGGIGL